MPPMINDPLKHRQTTAALTLRGMAVTGDDWSSADNLGAVALSEANAWRRALDLCASRVHDGGEDQQMDARMFLLALRQYCGDKFCFSGVGSAARSLSGFPEPGQLAALDGLMLWNLPALNLRIQPCLVSPANEGDHKRLIRFKGAIECLPHVRLAEHGEPDVQSPPFRVLGKVSNTYHFEVIALHPPHAVPASAAPPR